MQWLAQSPQSRNVLRSFRGSGLSVWNFYIRSLWVSSHSPKTYKLDWKDDCKLPPGTIVWGNGVCPAMDQQLVQNFSLYLICWALRSSWSWINSPFFQLQVIPNQPAKSYPYLCKVVLEVLLCVKIQQMSLKIIVTHVGGYCHIKSFIYWLTVLCKVVTASLCLSSSS